jgi:hypothetical protein
MSRNSKGAFSRSEEYDHWTGDCPLWLENFAAKQAAKEAARTAVDAARERMAQPNIYDQMSAIISGTAPRFSSVEDAVKDYQKRTGLDQYLKRAETERVQKAAALVVSAAEEKESTDDVNAVMYDYPGELEDLERLEKEKAKSRAAKEEELRDKFEERQELEDLEPFPPSASDLSEPALYDLSQPEGPEKEELMSRYLLEPELEEEEEDFEDEPESEFLDEAAASDSDEPAELMGDEDPEEIEEGWEEEPLFDISKEDSELRKALEELNLQDVYSPEELEGELSPEAEGDLEPEFRRVAAEKKTSEPGEKEDDTPELIISHPDVAHFIRNLVDTSHGIQLPAIQHAILEMFRRDGIAESHVDDPKLCRFINAILLDKAPSDNSGSFSNLGRGVGTQREYWDIRDSNRDPFVLLTPSKGVY